VGRRVGHANFGLASVDPVSFKRTPSPAPPCWAPLLATIRCKLRDKMDLGAEEMILPPPFSSGATPGAPRKLRRLDAPLSYDEHIFHHETFS
jgi:hypothetical protein